MYGAGSKPRLDAAHRGPLGAAPPPPPQPSLDRAGGQTCQQPSGATGSHSEPPAAGTCGWYGGHRCGEAHMCLPWCCTTDAWAAWPPQPRARAPTHRRPAAAAAWVGQSGMWLGCRHCPASRPVVTLRASASDATLAAAPPPAEGGGGAWAVPGRAVMLHLQVLPDQGRHC